MTTTTPEQMRALADENEDWVGHTSARVDRVLRLSATALRAAADRLEAVRSIGEHVAREYEADPALDAMLADLMTDTAPKGDRDE